MLVDPNKMPEFKKRAKKRDLRQKPIPKHKQPSIYVETKVEKRKS